MRINPRTTDRGKTLPDVMLRAAIYSVELIEEAPPGPATFLFQSIPRCKPLNVELYHPGVFLSNI